LLRYIQNSRNNHDIVESPYLFPDKYGGHISTNGIQQYFRRLAEKAGLKGVKVTPHVFRHTFGTNAAARDVNAFIIKDIMGHSSLQTTNKYIHLQTADMKAQHNRFSMVNDLFQKE
jgi:integrase/recombinase XerD